MRNRNKNFKVDLVHHTGSMVRFTTSQLPHLPSEDRFIDIILPDGAKFRSKFHRHPANPYIAGAELIQWIKNRVAFGKKETAILHKVSEDCYMVTLYQPKVHEKEKESMDLSRLLNKLKQASRLPTKERRKKYDVIIRERANSNLVKQIFGHKCQIENCEFICNVSPDIFPYFSEVHHLEHLCKGGDNSPYNLAVLCANHHSIFHRDKTAMIIDNRHDDVLISYNNGGKQEWIRRNLSKLHPPH